MINSVKHYEVLYFGNDGSHRMEYLECSFDYLKSYIRFIEERGCHSIDVYMKIDDDKEDPIIYCDGAFINENQYH